jgi:hypothetical protein
MERERSGRYSVRQPVSASGASAAMRARGVMRGSGSIWPRMVKRDGEIVKVFAIFAIYSPFELRYACRILASRAILEVDEFIQIFYRR